VVRPSLASLMGGGLLIFARVSPRQSFDFAFFHAIDLRNVFGS